MSKKFTLAAQKRDRAGKGVARALRREDKVPGVIYGDGKEPVMISLDANPVRIEYLKGHMTTNLCELKVGNDTVLTLARDVQLNPVTDKVEHVDFMRVSPKTTIHVKVPVHFINQETSPGLKAKGVLNVVAHEIDLICKASDIPETVEIDLGKLEIGKDIKISEVTLPKGSKPKIHDRDFAICSIVEPTVYTEVEVTAPASDAEVAAKAEAAKGDAKAAPAKAEAKK